MKNLFKAILIAASATILFACNKEVDNEKSLDANSKVRIVQFSAGEITKTVFGEPNGTSIPTLWTANKTVGISLNLASIIQSDAPEDGNNGATATFSAAIEDSGSHGGITYLGNTWSIEENEL